MQDSEQTVDISSTPNTDAVAVMVTALPSCATVVPAEFARRQERALREAMRVLAEAERFITRSSVHFESGFIRQQRRLWMVDYVNVQKMLQP